MEILVLSQYWYPENGVPQRRWRWLTQILVDEGHDVTVVAPSPHYQESVSWADWLRSWHPWSTPLPEIGPAGETILRSSFLPSGTTLTQKILNQGFVAIEMLRVLTCKRRFLAASKPDLVIGTVPALPTAVLTVVVGKILRTPVVIDLRDAWPDLLTEYSKWNEGLGERSFRERVFSRGPLQLLVFGARNLLWRSLAQAKGLVVTSRGLEDRMEAELVTRVGARPEIVTVRNVFPPETEVQNVPRHVRAEGELNVLYAGTLGRAQNLSNVLDAASIARTRGIRVRLRFVGTGAAECFLKEQCADKQLDAEFFDRRGAQELDEHYGWADTALVHLTDWPALRNAVPSKTYELMELGIHICAVAEGETAKLIRELHAGDVVSPESPRDLADLWVELSSDARRLVVPETGSNWVKHDRENVAPFQLLSLLSKVVPSANS